MLAPSSKRRIDLRRFLGKLFAMFNVLPGLVQFWLPGDPLQFLGISECDSPCYAMAKFCTYPLHVRPMHGLPAAWVPSA